MVLTGIQNWQELRNAAPVANALRAVGLPEVQRWVTLGALTGVLSSLLVFQLGQGRVWFAMSRDGLLPRAFSRVHPRFRTPHISTWTAGLFVAIPAGIFDIGTLADLSNIGTLFAFLLVSLGVLVLRRSQPERRVSRGKPFTDLVTTGVGKWVKIPCAVSPAAELTVMRAPTCACGLSLGARAKSFSTCVGGVLALTVWLLTCGAAYAWGPTAHRLANNWAVETLPSEIRGFFDANRQYLIDRANDPDEWMKKDRYERKRHYIYLDKYGLFPFLNLPHSFQRAVERYGSGRINRDGLLPWHIGEYSLRLTNALKAQNWEEAKLDAAALGHYVADAHDPLHTTQNFDGQLTGQTGLADRVGSRLIDRYQTFVFFRPEDAAKIDDPTEYAFQAVLESHTWVDQIILADRRSLAGLTDFNDEYFDRFYSQVGSIAMRQINAAAHDAGSYWYTAWLNAGRPALPGR